MANELVVFFAAYKFYCSLRYLPLFIQLTRCRLEKLMHNDGLNEMPATEVLLLHRCSALTSWHATPITIMIISLSVETREIDIDDTGMLECGSPFAVCDDYHAKFTI
jgi:hypothetical protein